MHKRNKSFQKTKNSFSLNKTNSRIVLKSRATGQQFHDQCRMTKSTIKPRQTFYSQRKQQIQQETDINKILQQLDKKADELIKRKLMKKMGYDNKLSLKYKNQKELDEELEHLVKQVKQLSRKSIDEKIGDQNEDKKFHEKKIRLMEKLLAQQSVEAESLKKDFFTINTFNQRKKYLQQKIIQKSQKVTLPKNDLNSRSVSFESTNRLSYKKPNPQDYQQYRYKQHSPLANKQPFPRSSYKSDFLSYENTSQRLSCKYRDSLEVLNKLRNKDSTYANNFKTIEAEKINYKQLDSYRNKLKNIQVSFQKKKVSPEKELINRKKLMSQELYKSPVKSVEKPKLQKLPTPKLTFVTESRKQYPTLRQMQEQMKSQVRNKDLLRLKYSYKNYAHA